MGLPADPAGIAIGLPNYFSIYFMLHTLSWYQNDGAFVYPVLNIAVIVVTSLMGIALFKEKLSKLNLIGIIIAILSIGLVFLNWRIFMKQLNSLY